MKTILAAVLFFAFSNLAQAHDHPGMTHLVFANGAIHAHATWVQGPQTPDESILRIEWKNGDTHSPLEPAGAFRVTLFMPSMGHDSSPTQIQKVVDSQGQALVGVYQVSRMYFTMGGTWTVNITLKYPDSSEETQSFAVDLAGGHPHH